MVKKGAMPNFKTVDDYIKNQSPEAQVMIQELRQLIKEAVPEVIELENYKVPSFTLVPNAKPQQQIMIMASTKHISFYPFEATVSHFSGELNDFQLGKGTVKFPLNKPLPKALIIKMVQFRKEEILATS